MLKLKNKLPNKKIKNFGKSTSQEFTLVFLNIHRAVNAY